MEREVLKAYLEKVDYWLNLTGLENKGSIRDIFIKLQDTIKIEDDKTGVFAYMIAPDFKGHLAFVEVFFFLHPDHRTFAKANKLLEKLERHAKINKCKSIKFGANFGHKDEMFLKYLRRKGYKDDTLSKEIEW